MEPNSVVAPPHLAPPSATPPTTQQRVNWGSMGQFILLAFGVSWATWLGLRALGVPFILRTAIGMFGPAVAALFMLGPLGHEGFADAGLRLHPRPRVGAWRLYLAAYLAIPLLLAGGLLLTLLIGYQHLVNPIVALETLLRQQLASAHKSLPPGFTLPTLATITLVEDVVLAFTLAIPINMLFAFGEEFGWRGYLLPRLAPLGGTWAALFVGVLWGLWHAPLIVLDGYNFPGHPWGGVALMVVFTTAYSLVFAWLRFSSGSIWPATLAHAALNAQAGLVLLVLSHGDSLLRPPIGAIGIVVPLAFGVWLAARSQLRPGTPDVTASTPVTMG